MSSKGVDLPPSWLAVTLGEVVNYGVTDKAEPDEIEPNTWVLELEDVERDSSRIFQRVPFSERRSKSTKNRFLPGDVLYGKLRPYLNKVVYADAPGVCTTEIVPIKPGPALAGRYLFHWLRHPEFSRYVTEVSHGVNMPRLGTEAGMKAPLVLAPLREQQRIGDKLDTVLARVDACRDRLASVDALLKRFRQSVVAAATSGRLTVDFRVYGSDDWTQTSARELKSHCELDVGYAFKSAEFEDEGVRLLRGDNIEPGRCRWIDAKCLPAAKLADFTHLMLRESDVVLAMDRPIISTGLKLARVRASDLPAVLVQRVCRFRPMPQLDSAFLFLVLQSSAFIEHLSSKQNGSSIPHISGGQILSYAFRVPPLAEQIEVVRRVETILTFADRLETRLAQVQTAVDRLTPALLVKAFRGELVPQDPADEPAAELLKRLAVQRDGAPAWRRRQRAAA